MSKRKFVSSIIACLCALASYAAPQVRIGTAPTWIIPVKSPDAQPNLREVNDGFYLRLIDEQISVEENAAYFRIIRHIISDAGVQGASNLSINFNPAYEQLTVHNITIWRNGQALNQLDQKKFKIIANEDDLSRYIYNGNYTAYLILDDIRTNDLIEYSYTLKGRNPIYGNKFFTTLTLQDTDPISQIHYLLRAPKKRQLDFKYINDASKPEVKDAGDCVVYEWNLPNVAGRESLLSAPGWYSHFPQVQISEYRTWTEVANWAYDINMPAGQLNGTLGPVVANIKSQNKNDQAGLLRALTDVVQNEVRYMGVEIGEYSHRANSPEKVYQQRYGDCKDKSLLLVSMLRNVGIDADVALVNSYKAKIGEWLPSPAAFNHAIVCAHTRSGDVWIDPTISYQGGQGTNIYCPDYGLALLLKPNTQFLTRMPQPTGGTFKYTERYDITDERSPVELTINTIYEKERADDIRSTFATQSKKDLEKSYIDYYTKVFPRIKSLDTLFIEDEKLLNKIETIERYNIDDFFSFDSASGNYLGSFYANTIRNALPQVKSRKDHPIAVSFPYNIQYQIRVNAPIKWGIEATTKHITRNAYMFAYDVSVEGNTLVINYDFSFLKDHIAPGEIAQYEKDRKLMVDDYLAFAFNYRTNAATTNRGLSYLAIFAAIVLMAGFAYACMRIYKIRTNHFAYAGYTPRTFGGWLILPAMGLAASAIRIAYGIYECGFFHKAVWHSYDSFSNSTQLRMLLWFEFVINFAQLALVIFCIVLMVKKRDILPRYITLFYVGSLIVTIADSSIVSMMVPNTEFNTKDISRSIFAVIIWVPYFARAARVKETFVVPYPAYLIERPEEYTANNETETYATVPDMVDAVEADKP